MVGGEAAEQIVVGIGIGGDGPPELGAILELLPFTEFS